MDFQEKVNELANNEQPLKARSLTFLSDLSSEDQTTLRLMWPGVDKERRLAIARLVAELGEDNIEFDFTRFFQMSADDQDARVRKASVEGLWEDNSNQTLRMLIDKLRSDPDPGVRAAAALALARFSYLAELGKLRGGLPEQLRGVLMAAVADKGAPAEVRRRAVEALAYLSADEEVTRVLAEAYGGGGKMKASALLGMGRNMDRRWEPILLHELQSADAEMRYEAARAVGEQGRPENAVVLLPLLEDDDVEVRLAAIWALGQLGGKVAEQALAQLAGAENPAEAEAAGAALEELRYNDDPLLP